MTKFYEILSFDIVSQNGNNVEAAFDFVAFDNVASTLLLKHAGVDGLYSIDAQLTT